MSRSLLPGELSRTSLLRCTLQTSSCWSGDLLCCRCPSRRRWCRRLQVGGEGMVKRHVSWLARSVNSARTHIRYRAS